MGVQGAEKYAPLRVKGRNRSPREINKTEEKGNGGQDDNWTGLYSAAAGKELH